MDGPVTLAGLCGDEMTLIGDCDHPEQLLAPDNEREFDAWSLDYWTRNQPHNLRFRLLYAVRDEAYTVDFPVAKPAEPSG